MQELVDVLGDALLLESLVVAVQLARGPDLYRQQVANRPHLERGSGRDPREHVVEVVGGDQVRRGGEHAVQPLLHRVELVLERGDLLGRAVGRLALGVPSDSIDAPRRAHRPGIPRARPARASSPNRTGPHVSNPDVHAQCSGLRGNPSAAVATTSAKPGPASMTSSLVTVLNSPALVAIAR